MQSCSFRFGGISIRRFVLGKLQTIITLLNRLACEGPICSCHVTNQESSRILSQKSTAAMAHKSLMFYLLKRLRKVKSLRRFEFAGSLRPTSLHNDPPGLSHTTSTGRRMKDLSFHTPPWSARLGYSTVDALFAQFQGLSAIQNYKPEFLQ